uniref:Uncharacterized protein n=1 Tax=Pelusios castaneus TaxID=367368 RepID=A0A8C8S0R6_9SAUR
PALLCTGLRSKSSRICLPNSQHFLPSCRLLPSSVQEERVLGTAQQPRDLSEQKGSLRMRRSWPGPTVLVLNQFCRVPISHFKRGLGVG